MKKSTFFTWLTLPVLGVLPLTFCSCSNQSGITKPVTIETNFNDEQATITNNKCFIGQDFSTFITLKMESSLNHLECFSGDKCLINGKDFIVLDIEKNIQLKIVGSAITSNILTINLFLDNFDANFTLSNGITLLTSKKVNYDNDFNCSLQINEGYKIKSILISDKKKHFVEDEDYSYTISDQNELNLIVESSAINCPFLDINICALKDGFEIEWNVTGAPPGEFFVSQTTAFVGEDFSTSFISGKESWYEVTSIEIFNDSQLLVKDTDFICNIQDNYVYVYIFGSAIVAPKLSFKITVYYDYDLKPIDLAALKCHSYWDTKREKNIDVIDGLYDGSKIEDCVSLRIPDFAEEVADNAFKEKFNDKSYTNISHLYFGGQSRLEKIGDGAFSGDTGFNKTVVLPNYLTSIGNDAFYGCTNIPSIIFPNFLQSIGDRAFKDCKGLTNIEFPNYLTEIGEEAFRNCTNIEQTLKFHRTTKEIKPHAFAGCNEITVIDLTDYTEVPFWVSYYPYGRPAKQFDQFCNVGEIWVSFESEKWKDLYDNCGLPNGWQIVVKQNNGGKYA